MTLKPINMFWVGPKLGRIEQLSIKSFLAAGHCVKLHSYQTIEGVPAGTDMVNAAETLPFEQAQMLRHSETGSFALASDLFRFRLMTKQLGFWSDTDVVCLRPVTLESDHVFGWEGDRFINGAFLYLDKNSPLLHEALESFRDNYLPPWLGLKRAFPFYLKRLKRESFGPKDLPWGSFGPRAITFLAKKHGQVADAQKREVFYPLRLKDAPRIFDRDFNMEIGDSTLLVHLWNERLKHIKETKPEAGSLLDRFYKQFDV
jgi:hypothetical protein